MANVALKSITERKALYETVVLDNKIVTLPYDGLYQIALSGGGGGGGGGSSESDLGAGYGGGGGGSGGCLIVLRRLQSGDTVNCSIGLPGVGGTIFQDGYQGQSTVVSINRGGVYENLSAPGGNGGKGAYHGGVGGLRGTSIGRDGQAGSAMGMVGGQGAIGSKYYAAGGNGSGSSSDGYYDEAGYGSSGQKGFVIISKVD